MPLKSKKSPAKKKSAAKPKSKAKAKPILRAVKSVKSASKPKKEAKSIFWKILEERKRQQENGPPQPYKTDHRGHHPQAARHDQFVKFAGPRRRAA